MKAVYLFILVVFSISCKSQIQEKLDFKQLKVIAIDFLVEKNIIKKENAKDYKNDKYTIFLTGVLNNLSNGELKNGMYAFGTLNSHSKSFFVLIEDNKYFILDISSREGLNKSIIETLDFCERNKFCVNISTEYISRITRVYYNKNKNPLTGFDINCEKGLVNTDDLP
jgi:hypothetical protein